jgi:F-type H+-transporting ATPase subunit delta
MAELGTLARPYAKAIYEIALKQDVFDLWAKDLSIASEVLDCEDANELLSNPSLTTENQASIFKDICGEKISNNFKNLINILAENKRLALVPEIEKQFTVMRKEYLKTLDVNIYTAFEIPEDIEHRLLEALKNKISKEITATIIIDKSLIGGVVIEASHMVIDGSTKGRLEKLTEIISA